MSADRWSLGHPTWPQAVLGAAVASGIFTAITTVVVTASTIVSYAVTAPIPAVNTGPGAVASVAVFAFIVSTIVSSVISLTWGVLTGMLLGTALARVRAWPVHAFGFFLLGALTPLLASLLLFRAVDVASPLLQAAMVVTGVSVVVGRCVASRAVARPRLPLVAERLRHGV